MNNMEDEKTILLTENVDNSGEGSGVTSDIYNEANNNCIPKTAIWKSKKFLIITGICVIAVIAIITTIVIIAGNGQSDIEERLETANRYLLELDYGQAKAEFEKIIEVDPKCVDAYIGLAEAYEGLGKSEKARETLEEGYKKTKSDKIKKLLDDIEETSEETTTEKAVIQQTTEQKITEQQTTTVQENTTKQQTTTVQENTTGQQTTTVQENTTKQQTTTVQEQTTEQATSTVSNDMKNKLLLAAKDIYNNDSAFNSYCLSFVLFYDFNMDEIPEMCILEASGNGFLSGDIYSYENEKYSELMTIYGLSELATYRNAQGKYISVHSYHYSMFAGAYGGVEILYPYITNDSVKICGYEYDGDLTTYYDSNNTEITKEQYDRLLSDALVGYTKVKTHNWGVTDIGDNIDEAFETAYNLFLENN